MKYPLGIQDFRSLREGGYVYVDKTEQICRVADAGKYFFLARPRRFGKSLTVSTLHELYSGSAELFEGLWAGEHWDFAARRRPVVWLKFASSGFRTAGLKAALHRMVDASADQLGIDLLPDGPFDARFDALLRSAAAISPAGRVVLLIDEYDKPIIDYLNDIERAEANRDLLKSFYSVLKDADPILELVFITGVSAFAKVSIFSDLNNVTNLSLDPLAYDLVGITPAELEGTFAAQLDATDFTRETIREWYNGYSWGGDVRVYNPWSLLTFLRSGLLRNYWFETGTPTFLVEAMRAGGAYDVRGVQASAMGMLDFDLRHLDPVTVLFQTGYLTVVDSEPEYALYTLDYPNREVRQSLERMLLRLYLDRPPTEPMTRVRALHHAFERGDLEGVIAVIDATFAELPFEHWRRDDEHLFHAIVHLLFNLLGVHVRSEVHTARGRCDAIVETDARVYAFEFKRDRPAAEALAQIRERGYLDRFADGGRERVAVGVSFDSERKAVREWAVEGVG